MIEYDPTECMELAVSPRTYRLTECFFDRMTADKLLFKPPDGGMPHAEIPGNPADPLGTAV